MGGTGAENQDFVDAIYGSFPLMVALIAVLTFLLLARAFRSLLLPLKAVLLNVISVGAAWGVITLVWQQGHGSDALWGISATHSVDAWIPLMVFAFLFGLSMDYEVFILARMREEFDASGSTDTAVVRGIGRTGRLVTSAALILFLAFASMASAPDTPSRCSPPGWPRGSSSTPPSSGRCWCPRWCRCSGAGTGGCPSGRRGCCASSPRSRHVPPPRAPGLGNVRHKGRYVSLSRTRTARYSGVVYAPLIPPSTRNSVALT